MLDAQKRLSTGFLILLSLPTAAVGFALSSGIATTTWLLSTLQGLPRLSSESHPEFIAQRQIL